MTSKTDFVCLINLPVLVRAERKLTLLSGQFLNWDQVRERVTRKKNVFFYLSPCGNGNLSYKCVIRP